MSLRAQFALKLSVSPSIQMQVQLSLEIYNVSVQIED